MRYRAELTLRRSESALTRVLSTAEMRGFVLLGVHADLSPQDQWRLSLRLEGGRTAEWLRVQLAKLYDCLEVEVWEEP